MSRWQVHRDISNRGLVCQQKLVYANKAKARVACAERMLQTGYQLWIYKCGCCHWWHITSSAPRDTGVKSNGYEKKTT